ncbi:MAG: hypothetical protein HOQ26_01310 [Gemmatimonadaceae bacterium]|nr:hypothetical protein [Gemmatimonadaceae bacterium]NUQ91526.1 hypothetical protein [Gemmatimonadaceae bacterium]
MAWVKANISPEEFDGWLVFDAARAAMVREAQGTPQQPATPEDKIAAALAEKAEAGLAAQTAKRKRR